MVWYLEVTAVNESFDIKSNLLELSCSVVGSDNKAEILLLVPQTFYFWHKGDRLHLSLIPDTKPCPNRQMEIMKSNPRIKIGGWRRFVNMTELTPKEDGVWVVLEHCVCIGPRSYFETLLNPQFTYYFCAIVPENPHPKESL